MQADGVLAVILQDVVGYSRNGFPLAGPAHILGSCTTLPKKKLGPGNPNLHEPVELRTHCWDKINLANLLH
jgi:hypothetical protein